MNAVFYTFIRLNLFDTKHVDLLSEKKPLAVFVISDWRMIDEMTHRNDCSFTLTYLKGEEN